MIIGVTGHRPDKCGGFSDDVLIRMISVARSYLEPRKVIKLISGMAVGWDTACAIAALKLGIPLVAAIPFDGQDMRWPKEARERYRHLCGRAGEVVRVCEGGYAAWKLQKRNEWVVDESQWMLALWDGSAGGTGNCVAYAEKVGREWDNLWPEFSRLRAAA
jgi:uncharacterized phage-like protein YoqJ